MAILVVGMISGFGFGMAWWAAEAHTGYTLMWLAVGIVFGGMGVAVVRDTQKEKKE